jgi:hypothetical protein
VGDGGYCYLISRHGKWIVFLFMLTWLCQEHEYAVEGVLFSILFHFLGVFS